MKNLTRTKKSKIVHSTACYCVPLRPQPWLWAEYHDSTTILRVMKVIGYRPCTVCKPFGANPYGALA